MNECWNVFICSFLCIHKLPKFACGKCIDLQACGSVKISFATSKSCKHTGEGVLFSAKCCAGCRSPISKAVISPHLTASKRNIKQYIYISHPRLMSSLKLKSPVLLSPAPSSMDHSISVKSDSSECLTIVVLRGDILENGSKRGNQAYEVIGHIVFQFFKF